VHHPIAQDALLRLRDKTIAPGEFRRLAYRVSLLVIAEATARLPLMLARVETPLEAAAGEALLSDVVLVPVLRAGMGMLDAALDLLPHARVGHIGLARDEGTAVARRYCSTLPAGLEKSTILILDPMVATGGSANAAIADVLEAGGQDVRFVSIVSAPEGIAAVTAAHPAIDIFPAAVDRELNARKFILPGLGDFGDRLYGTH
jgi:uracil phosphoribosyltransferase